MDGPSRVLSCRRLSEAFRKLSLYSTSNFSLITHTMSWLRLAKLWLLVFFCIISRSNILVGDVISPAQVPTLTPQLPSASPSMQATEGMADDAAARLRAFWAPHGEVDPGHEKLIRYWMDAHGLQDEPLITTFIRSATYENLRRMAADELVNSAQARLLEFWRLMAK